MSEWVIIELSQVGESTDPATLQRVLDRLLNKERDVFIPAVTYVKRGIPTTLYYLQGYVFVRAGLPSGRYFDLLNNSFFSSVLYTQDGDKTYLQLLPQSEIDKIRKALQDYTHVIFAEGDTVVVTAGVYKDLKGVCKGMVTEDTCTVLFKMRSVESVVELPVAMLALQGVDDND